MKLVYVSDNRTGVNWGCRATSFALDELLREKNEIVYTVFREEKFRKVMWSDNAWLTQHAAAVLNSPAANRLAERAQRSIINKFSRRRIFIEDYVSFDTDRATDRFEKLTRIDPKYAEIKDAVEASEGIVINGEGDFIQNPARRTMQFLLVMINYAKRKNRKIYLVNTIYSPCPVNGSPHHVVQSMLNEMRKCDRIFVRDNSSKKLLNAAGLNEHVEYVPDALFTWVKYLAPEFRQNIKYGSSILPHPYDHFFGNLDFTQPYICVAGSSADMRNSKGTIVSAFVKLVKALQKIARVYLVNPGTDFFLDEIFKQTGAFVIPNTTPVLLGATVLANASLFVSGRYHPSVMAACGGTPLICFESNSHKMESLQDLMQCQPVTKYPMEITDDQIFEIAKSAARIIGDRGLREKILKQAIDNSEYVKKFYNQLTAN